jgi:riboflavin kinase
MSTVDNNDGMNYDVTAGSPPSRAQLLPNVLRYRGPVDQGYGRGGKKLGVPTANLPSSLFQNALEDVTAGVYFGWAALEKPQQQKQSRSSSLEVYKTVVNVGYSPTFEGQENPEKIIEAHLILGDEDDTSKDENNDGDNYETTGDPSSSSSSSILDDFYGVPMRLQLIGFLRAEKKFSSLPELITQIHADVEDAKTSLDYPPYMHCRKDLFISSTGPSSWVGIGGGDKIASWEVIPMMHFLSSLGIPPSDN